jgi:uncharacterized protein (TIGR02452 family)
MAKVTTMGKLNVLSCLDSEQIAASRRRELYMPAVLAASLGKSAVEAARQGFYITEGGLQVNWGDEVRAACSGKISIPPDGAMPAHGQDMFPETKVQVTNETTLGASLRLVERGLQPLALNFANGIYPGGGFLRGATAQEEALCRSSALFLTLEGDPMYAEHRKRPLADSTDWAIYSPRVPVFRMDDGTELQRPWLLSFITCAAPYAPDIGQPQSRYLLQQRIRRVLEIAQAYGHSALVLGAWGCGAFQNDPLLTAVDFRQALECDFSGAFSEVVFAIADWSPERRFLGPFRDIFAASGDAEDGSEEAVDDDNGGAGGVRLEQAEALDSPQLGGLEQGPEHSTELAVDNPVENRRTETPEPGRGVYVLPSLAEPLLPFRFVKPLQNIKMQPRMDGECCHCPSQVSDLAVCSHCRVEIVLSPDDPDQWRPLTATEKLVKRETLRQVYDLSTSLSQPEFQRILLETMEPEEALWHRSVENMMQAVREEYMTGVFQEAKRASANPADARRTITDLKAIGFPYDAFELLHHLRDNIDSFCKYSSNIRRFEEDGNNHRVHQRLKYVLLSCPAGTRPSPERFVALAQEAWQKIPPV